MKNIKKIILMLLVFISTFASINVLNVEAKAPKKVTVKPKSQLYYYSETKKTDYISGYNFYRKQLTDGTYAYCVSNINTKVPGGMTLNLKGEVTDQGLDYIIKNGWPNKTMTGNKLKDYYITQSAIWEYYDETRGTNNWGKTTFNANSTGMKKYVYNLVVGAKNANKVKIEEPSITLSYIDTDMTLNADRSYFVSKEVNVSLVNTTGTYTVSIDKAPEGTILKNEKGEVKTTFNSGEKLFVYVPATAVKDGESGSVSLVINATGLRYVTYIYVPGVVNYQKITPAQIYKEEVQLTTETPIVFNFTKDKIVTKVRISKQDITTKEELPGAMLSIKDSTGKVVEQWMSTTEPHYIEGLAPGNYTLGEAIAPAGYVLSYETIPFTVRDDGSVTNVVMYNAKEEVKVTKVKISKQDITSKEELPGATLELRDKDGKLIEKWVSTNEPHYIEGLAEGNYFLTETIAPKGYILSTETITFEVKNDGKVTSVVMYNAKETKVTKVKVSKQDITNNKELPGATLVIKDANGKVVDEWVSGNEPHYIEGLNPGDYTLTEKVAPNGYTLSEEIVKFTVLDDGSMTSVVMYNTPQTPVPITDMNVSPMTMIIASILIALGTGVVVYYVKFAK